MSFLVYCLLLILYLDASNARHVGVIDTELHDQKYHIPRKGRVQDHVKKEEQRKSLSRSGTNPFLLDGIEDAQGNDQITSFPDQVAVKTEKWRRYSRRTEKKNDPDFLEEVEVTDYAQSRRKSPIHN